MIELSDGRCLYHTPTPDNPADALQALVNFWSSATKSLYIVDYSFNLPIFETLIPTLLDHGVEVTLVLDKSQSAGSTEKPLISSLNSSGAKFPSLFSMTIGTSSMHQILHDKFSVVDGVDAEYGSFNFTTNAGKEDNFFFIEPTSPVAGDLVIIGNSIKSWIIQNQKTT